MYITISKKSPIENIIVQSYQIAIPITKIMKDFHKLRRLDIFKLKRNMYADFIKQFNTVSVSYFNSS